MAKKTAKTATTLGDLATIIEEKAATATIGQRIIGHLQAKPVAPAIPYGSMDEDVAREYADKLKDYDTAKSEYQKSQKALKAELHTYLATAGEGEFIAVCEDLRQGAGTLGKDAVRTTTWTNDIRSQFEQRFAGKVLLPLKDGVKITGYAITAGPSKELTTLVATLTALSSRFPSLFIPSVSPAVILDTVEREEELAREQAAVKAILAESRATEKSLLAELSRVQAKVADIQSIDAGYVPGEAVTATIADISNNLAKVRATIAMHTA